LPLHQSNKWISRWRLRNSLSSRWRCGRRRWSHTLQARWEQSSWSLRKRKERGEHWKARRREGGRSQERKARRSQ